MSCKFTSYKRQVLSVEQEKKNRILNRLGAIAEGYAVKKCPVDTGRLRGSITHEQFDDNTEIVGTNVEYAPFVELGHHTRSGKRVNPQPFLRPAIEDHRAEYRRIIDMELRK